MQLLRSGGDYLRGKRRRHVLALAGAIAVGGAAMAWLGVSVHPAVGLAAGASAAWAARRALADARAYDRGIRGESYVTDMLAGLSDDYVVVNDVLLRGGRGNVDHVVVGPCGVVVIETKHYGGSVRVFGRKCFVGGGPGRDVGGQVARAAAGVRELLVRRHPELARGALRYVETIIVFSNPLARLRIDRPDTTIARVSQLRAVLADKARRVRMPADLVSRLAATLVEGALPTPVARS